MTINHNRVCILRSKIEYLRTYQRCNLQSVFFSRINFSPESLLVLESEQFSFIEESVNYLYKVYLQSTISNNNLARRELLDSIRLGFHLRKPVVVCSSVNVSQSLQDTNVFSFYSGDTALLSDADNLTPADTVVAEIDDCVEPDHSMVIQSSEVDVISSESIDTVVTSEFVDHVVDLSLLIDILDSLSNSYRFTLASLSDSFSFFSMLCKDKELYDLIALYLTQYVLPLTESYHYASLVIYNYKKRWKHFLRFLILQNCFILKHSVVCDVCYLIVALILVCTWYIDTLTLYRVPTLALHVVLM